MHFYDEFEQEASDGNVYMISVVGHMVQDQSGEYSPKIIESSMTDHLGNPITDVDDVYDELMDLIEDREYEVEEHSSNWDYYGDHVYNEKG